MPKVSHAFLLSKLKSQVSDRSGVVHLIATKTYTLVSASLSIEKAELGEDSVPEHVQYQDISWKSTDLCLAQLHHPRKFVLQIIRIITEDQVELVLSTQGTRWKMVKYVPIRM